MSAPDQQPPSPELRGGLRTASVATIAAVALVAIAFIGSLAFVLYVALAVEDKQIELLGYGFAVMGASLVAIAIGALFGMWRAASRARVGRALGLAILGGLAGMFAIGCFAFTAIATMVGGT